MKKMVLSSFLVELMISALWGMLTSLAARHRTSVPSNSDCNTGFKALKALIILLSCESTVTSADHPAHTL